MKLKTTKELKRQFNANNRALDSLTPEEFQEMYECTWDKVADETENMEKELISRGAL